MGPGGIPLPLLKHHMKCKSPVEMCWDQVSPKAGVKQSDLGAPLQEDTSTHKSAGRGDVGGLKSPVKEGKAGNKDPPSEFLCINYVYVRLMGLYGNRIIELCKFLGKKP